MIKDNFVKYYEKSIIENWDYPAMTDYEGDTFFYRDVAFKIKYIHELFNQCGVEKGDKIALLGKNSAHWGVLYLATTCYGATIVPILPDFHANEIHHIVNHSDAKLLFAGNMLWNNIDEKKMDGLCGILSIEKFEVLFAPEDSNVKENLEKAQHSFNQKYIDGCSKEDFKFPEVSNDEIGIINYTSGTSGFSKGLVLKLNALAANVQFARNNLPLGNEESVVSILPLAHTFGCAFEFLWPISMGCHVHFLTRTPSPKIIVKAFKEIKPSVVIAVPLIIEKIYKNQIKPSLDKKLLKLLTSIPVVDKSVYQKINKKLSDVFGGNFKEVIIGGAPLSSEVATFLHKIKFKYTVGYGMTECGPLISYADWKTNKLHSTGKVMNSLEIKIDDPNQKTNVGEIMVRGENVMTEYYKRPDATKMVLDENGWLRTGDLGTIDNDGFIFIKGRNKSLILGASGENIYPEEIESIINNAPLVMESLVLKSDNNLIALVYPDYATVDKLKIRVSHISEYLEAERIRINKELPKYKQISKFKLYPNEFEKTPKKSIKRYLYKI